MTLPLDHAFTAPYERDGETLCGYWYAAGEWHGYDRPIRCGYGPERDPKAGA